MEPKACFSTTTMQALTLRQPLSTSWSKNGANLVTCPLYSPGLALLDWCMFPFLKKQLRGYSSRDLKILELTSRASCSPYLRPRGRVPCAGGLRGWPSALIPSEDSLGNWTSQLAGQSSPKASSTNLLNTSYKMEIFVHYFFCVRLSVFVCLCLCVSA